MSYAQLLELIGNAPGLKLLEATTHADALSEALARHVQTCGGELHIAAYPGEHTVRPEGEGVKFTEIPNFNSPFKASARDYEFIILNDVLHLHAFQEKLLKHAYQGLENSAFIVIIQSEGSMPAEEIEMMLERCEYRAGNTIHDLIEGTHVTVAKKLHMWGNGM